MRPRRTTATCTRALAPSAQKRPRGRSRDRLARERRPRRDDRQDHDRGDAEREQELVFDRVPRGGLPARVPAAGRARAGEPPVAVESERRTPKRMRRRGIPRTPTAAPTPLSQGTAPPGGGTPPRRRSSPPARPPTGAVRAGDRPRRRVAQPATPTNRAPPARSELAAGRRSSIEPSGGENSRATPGATAALASASRTRHASPPVRRSTVHVRSASRAADANHWENQRPCEAGGSISVSGG